MQVFSNLNVKYKSKKMDCRNVKDNMLDYAEGKTSAELRNAMSEHLNSCAGCEGYFKTVLEFLAVVEKEKAIPVNPFLITRIEAKLKSGNEIPVLSLRTRFLRSYYYYAAVIIIALTIGVFTGKQLGNLLNINQNNTVISSETEQLKQDFYLNEIEKDDVSQVLNNQ
jgi:predicted anti-sigma-YlaC factor YlaD